MFALSKAADLNWLVQGGQLYWAFPFSKVSVPKLFTVYILVPWIGSLSNPFLKGDSLIRGLITSPDQLLHFTEMLKCLGNLYNGSVCYIFFRSGVNPIKLFWCKFTHTFLCARPFIKWSIAMKISSLHKE